jgi:hypothetical protein
MKSYLNWIGRMVGAKNLSKYGGPEVTERNILITPGNSIVRAGFVGDDVCEMMLGGSVGI